MRHKVLAFMIMVSALTVCAAARPTATQTAPPSAQTLARKTIFIPAMDGYEDYVASAFRSAEVPVDIVTVKSKADLQVRPTFSYSRTAQKGTGHEPFSWLDVVEVDTNRTVVSYPFLCTDYEVTRGRDAQEFARELKNKLVPRKKRTR